MKKLGLAVLVLVAGCGNSSVTQQSGAAACLTASACGIYTGGISFCTQFISLVNDPVGSDAAHLSPGEVNCIANSGSDCTAAKKCLAGNQTPAVCSGSSETCQGNTWTQCTDAAGSGGNKGVQTYDCMANGKMCVAMNGNVDCGYGTCATGPATCVSPDGTPNGNFVQSCDNGILQRQDCGRINASCNPSNGAHCRGNGPPCTATNGDDTLRCDGTTLVSCADGQEARYDCGTLNLGCYNNPSTGLFAKQFGCFAANECNPSNFTATCVGLKLTFCNKGKVDTADCGAAGFAGCSPNAGGSCTK